MEGRIGVTESIIRLRWLRRRPARTKEGRGSIAAAKASEAWWRSCVPFAILSSGSSLLCKTFRARIEAIRRYSEVVFLKEHRMHRIIAIVPIVIILVVAVQSRGQVSA